MKKSLYMWIRIVSHEDMQTYVEVSMSSMKLAIFDLKSLSFVEYAFSFLLRKASFKYDELMFDDVKLMVNVSSYKDVRVNLYIDRKFEADCSFREIVSAFGKPLYRPNFSDELDMPDLLKLLSYFLTESQMKLAGINYGR